MAEQTMGRERPLNDEEAVELMARLTERATHDPTNDNSGADSEQADGGDE